MEHLSADGDPLPFNTPYGGTMASLRIHYNATYKYLKYMRQQYVKSANITK